MRYKINYHSGGNKLKVIDCFTFYNEIKFLQFRLEELYDYVDYFVIVEANKTFSGKDKEFKFEKAINEFVKYMSKIIYIKVEDMPLTSNAWDRETFQRNCILRGLEKISLNSEDIIIIGDLDEVPKVSILNEVRNGNINEIKTLDLDFYYYNLQCKQDRVWKGNVLLPYKLMYGYTPQILRDQRFSFSSISNSGWHLSYFSDETQIVKKIKNFSHQEYNNPEFTNPTEIAEKINKCQDLFKRSDHELTYIPIEKNTNLPNNYSLLVGGSSTVDDLTKFGLLYQTDKAYWHQYTKFYNDYFKRIRYNKNKILEIGIGSTNTPSAKMLSAYFENSDIYLIDIMEDYIKEANKIKNVTAFICDSSNKKLLEEKFSDITFDLIIDDGSHIDYHQKNAFEVLFNYLRSGGIYVCEDLHPSGSIDNSHMIDYFNDHEFSKKFKLIKVYNRQNKALRCYECKKLNTLNLNMCSCGINLLPNKNDSITLLIIKQ